MVIQGGSVPTPQVGVLQSDRPSVHTRQSPRETQSFATAATTAIVLLLAAVVVLGGWAVVIADAYAEPSGSTLMSLGAAPSRQQAIDAALHDIGPPAAYRQVRREDGLVAAGTAVTDAPDGEVAVGWQFTDLPSAWVRGGP
jgi:hypothetical protein